MNRGTARITNTRFNRAVSLVLLTAFTVLGAGVATASTRSTATSKLVTGKLSKPGYTVVAVGYNGKAVTSKARSFRIRAPHGKVTLQLLDKSGRYAGPVVVGKSRRGVLTGVRAGASLGVITVHKGYAKVARRVPARLVDARRVSAAVRGVPVGNGRNFGLVKSSRKGATGAGLDKDLDGVPNVFDVDVDGDRVLNALEPKTLVQPPPAAARRAVAGQLTRAELERPSPPDGTTPPPDGTTPPPDGTTPPPGGTTPPPPPAPATHPAHWMSQIFLTLEDSLNANAGSVTREQIDAMLQKNLSMVLLNVPEGDVVELVCGGLAYCSPGGTGELGGVAPDVSRQAFPACCAASSGYGLLRGSGAPQLETSPGGGTGDFRFWPNAISSKVGTGDAMMLKVTKAGVVTETPAPVEFVFVTVPAVSSYADSTGNAGTITYPVPAGAPGTAWNPIEVAAGPDGHVVLTLNAWRPQRLGVPGAAEPTFMDVGNLKYSVAAPPQPGVPTSNGPPQCSADSLSTNSPLLSLHRERAPQGPDAGRLIDSSPDRPADASQTLAMTVDLTKCVEDKGGSFAVGSSLGIEIEASAQGSPDHANQRLWVRRTA